MESIEKIKITALKIFFTGVYLFFCTFCRLDRKRIYLMSARASDPSIGLKILKKELKKNTQIHTKYFYFGRSGNQKDYLKNSIKSLRKLATSKVVVIDDHFFAINALYYKRKKNTVIQIWHAAGTIKKFGNYEGNKTLVPHKNYDYVCVNKESDREVYAKSLGVKLNKTIVTGSLQLFYIYKKSKNNNLVKNQLFYAPTYRSGENDYSKKLVKDIIQNFEERYQNSDMELKISLHPYVNKAGIDSKYIVDTADFYDELLASKVLVTDYSSLMIDFSILNRPVYLYTPDYEIYKEKIGFFSNNFGVEYLFPKFDKINQLMETINEVQYNFSTVEKVKNRELTAVTEHALRNVIDLITKSLI